MKNLYDSIFQNIKIFTEILRQIRIFLNDGNIRSDDIESVKNLSYLVPSIDMTVRLNCLRIRKVRKADADIFQNLIYCGETIK
jgi:hypothetical protein